jgi:pentatricopeptide repeat protein
MTFKGKPVDAKEIGKELRVRYVLEGSVQRDQNRVRVTYSNLAAAYAQAGKMNEAKAALAEARSRNPELTVKWVKEHGPNLPALFDGLRKAGLPEQ